MRKPLLAVFAAIVILALCACGSSGNPSDNSQEPVQSSTDNSYEPEQSSTDISDEASHQPPEDQDPLYKNYRINDLGIPLVARYSKDERAITPWDMIVYKNGLYVGSGDCAANSGPIDMLKYDIENGYWINSGTLPDEQISRFYIIDDTLFAPGIDPRESWAFGNIYYTNGSGWEKIRTIPNSSHCFDITVCDDKLFAAIEYEKDQSSRYAAVSENGGQEFKIVPLLKDGKPVPRNDFLANIYTLKNKTFVIVNEDGANCTDVYLYDGESFKYYCSWAERIRVKANQHYFLSPSKASFNDDLYLVTGYLYKCESIDATIKIDLPNDEIARDLYKYEDELYVMGLSKKDGDYIMTVYRIIAPSDEFEKILEFKYETPAISFAMGEKSFYFGLESLSNSDKDTNNGRILEIEIID